ncbi:molybdopterin-dependent oxidoreductase [Aquibaculum sediminis]|uniref:molybdopterin-dependent oxidoreductase n=1 Tax=Aquibaculum sediminis TaxID=3231907 RepID=UPI0034530E70
MSDVKAVQHASHWGAYRVLVQDGRIVGTEPIPEDPAPSPIIGSITDWVDRARRIAQPMARESWLEAKRAGRPTDGSGRGQERFVPLSWEEAFRLVASEIDRVRQDHGNDAIFAGSYGWTSCGRFHHAPSQLKRMLNLVGGYTGHVDTYSIAAGPAILRHTLGNDEACVGKASTFDAIAEHTQTLLVFGALAPRTAQNEAGGIGAHTLEENLKRIAERGVRVIHISPVKDDLPEWVGAEWWPIRPNSDTALMLALAQEIRRAGNHDLAFLERYTSGTDLFLDYLAGHSDGVEKTAEWAASLTGLDAQAIRDLAARLPATRSMITVSWSLQRAQHGEQPYWAALGLASVIGQIGLPGGGVGYGYGSLGGMGAAIPLSRSPSLPQLTKPNRAFIPVARITDLLLNPGGAFDYEGKSYRYPETRMVYWAGGNPYHHHQDLNRLERAWARPETIVVQDPCWTATALRADIVLPATTSLERNDIAGNRRCDLIVAMQKAVEPLGEARNDFDIFCGLAKELGVLEDFTEGRDEMGWLRHMYEKVRHNSQERFGHAMPDFEGFWEAGYVPVPTKENHTYLEAFRADPDASPLTTESGRIVLGSQLLAERCYEDCLAHPAWLPPQEWLDGKRAGFHLLSNQPTGRLHSQLHQGPTSLAEKRNGREQLRLNPADAEKLAIADGATVRVWNERGSCLATASLSDAMAPGVVVLPTGSWLTYSQDRSLELSGNPNVLTPDVPTSSFGQGCAAHTCMVQIEAYDGPAPDPTDYYDRSLRQAGVRV